MRNTFIIIGVVLAVLLAGAWFYLSNVDAQIKTGIEKYGSAISGASVQVGQVQITPQSGVGHIKNLTVGNPAGFSIPQAFSIPEISFKLDLHSLSSDTVLIHAINIIAPEIYVEQNTAGNNIRMIRAAIHAFLLAHTPAPDATLTAEEQAAAGKRFIIQSFTMQNAKLHAQAPLVQAEVVTVPLSDIQVNDIGKDSGGVQAAQALDIIMQQISAHINQAVIARNLQHMIEVEPASTEPGIVDRIRGFFTTH